MNIFVLTVFCILFSTGHQQEAHNAYDLSKLDSNKDVGDQIWPSQYIHNIQSNLNGQAPEKLDLKPCSRRSNSESDIPIQQPRTPPFKPKVVKPVSKYDSTYLKPDLGNEDYRMSILNSNQAYSSNQPSNEEHNMFQASDTLSIINPPIASAQEGNREVIRSNKEEVLEPLNAITYDSRSAFHIDSSDDVFSVPGQYVKFGPTDDFNSAPYSEQHYETNKILRSDPIMDPLNEFHIEKPKQKLEGPYNSKILTTESPNKCSNTKEPSHLIEHSRRSMSSYNDDPSDFASDNLNNNKDLLKSGNDPYDKSRVGNEKAMAAVLKEDTYLNIATDTKDPDSLNYLEKAKSPSHDTYKSITRVGRPQFNEARRQMMEPTRGSGVSNMGQTPLVMMQTERICYACSTANNPTCWAPDRRTTVKYCRKGNNACITKTFGSGSTFTLIRDCGRSCDDSEMGGLMPRYKSCSMCHSELCNGAYSINGHSLLLALFLMFLIKYLN